MQSDISNQKKQKNFVIFTDLDGTLLDHETYSTQEAEDSLGRLRACDIPLIFASSKTAAEVQELRLELGIDQWPAIVENGAGVLEADTVSCSDESTYKALLSVVDELPLSLRDNFIGFSDLSAKELAVQTGLSVANANLAKQRQFSEPGLWLGDEISKAEFIDYMVSRNITIQEGGRFLCLSFGGNKANQVLLLTSRFKTLHGDVLTVALGDAANDIEMLQAVDIGVIIPNPSHAGIPPLDGEADGSIVRATLPGPSGWNQSINSILDNSAKYGKQRVRLSTER